MKVIVKQYELVEREVDFEFPIYFEYSDGDRGYWCETLTRITEAGDVTSVSMTTDDEKTEYEFTVINKGLSAALAEYLKQERATAEEYAEAVQKARAAIDASFPAGGLQ